jgi:hypothetical protein
MFNTDPKYTIMQIEKDILKQLLLNARFQSLGTLQWKHIDYKIYDCLKCNSIVTVMRAVFRFPVGTRNFCLL